MPPEQPVSIDKEAPRTEEAKSFLSLCCLLELDDARLRAAIALRHAVRPEPLGWHMVQSWLTSMFVTPMRVSQSRFKPLLSTKYFSALLI